jgi:hypothetical protein
MSSKARFYEECAAVIYNSLVRQACTEFSLVTSNDMHSKARFYEERAAVMYNSLVRQASI